MSAKHVLIFSERPPPTPDAPTTGLSLRHALMADALSAAGFDVTYAWPGAGHPDGNPDRKVFDRPVSFSAVELDTPDELAHWIARFEPRAVVLGYWEFADWIPDRLKVPLVLDHVAPRLLERQFEDRDRLAGDIDRLLPLLARCDEVWVGNSRQADLMLSNMILAGHDCRFQAPISVVPIAGRVDPHGVADAADSGGKLRLFHGGRDWPWRKSGLWLEALRDCEDAPWHLIDASEQGGFGRYADYRRVLAGADLLLELSDDNVERRFSQSFRMTDALCTGIPVICNDFLPLAEVLMRKRAGWTIARPEELPVLLQSIANDRDELAVRGGNALELARAQLNADTVYGGLGGRLERLAERARGKSARRPLVSRGDTGASTSMRRVVADHARRWIHHRVRLPFHNFLRRRGANRPQPTPSQATWIVVSRSDVFPTNHGAAVKIERTAWGLSFHLESVVLLTDRRDGYWLYRQGERSFQRFPLRKRIWGWPRVVNLLRLMKRGLPYSNAFLYLPLVDRGIHARLLWLLGQFPVEVVQGEFPAYAHPAVWAARLFGTRSLMVEHNIEFQRIASQVGELNERARLYLKHVEVDLANSCDHVITVSDRDRQGLVKAGVREALVHTVPHGVDLARFEVADPVDLRMHYDIPADHAVLVYHGIYSYPPNLEAVEELSRVLLPRLKAAGHSATVVAMGPEPPASSLAGVVFTGAVDDLAGHLKGGDLAVIPLRQGGGTRMKILDDFAAQVPVVTTRKGMEGIDVEHGRQLLIIDDPDEMVEGVAGLLEDRQAARDLAEVAAHWVSRFDWREIALAYVERVRGAEGKIDTAPARPGRKIGNANPGRKKSE